MILSASRRLRTGSHRPAWALAAAAVVLASLSALAAAVAPLAPDAADLPTRTLSLDVTPMDPGPQLEALAAQGQSFSRTVVIKGPDNLAAALRRVGAEDPQAIATLARQPAISEAMALRSARQLAVRLDSLGRLESLTIRHASTDEAEASTRFVRVVATREQAQWGVTRQSVPLGSALRFASGVIHSSLFAATDEAGLDDGVAVQLAEIFASDVDFHRQLRKGDSFALVYEALTADGEPVPWTQGAGRVLAAELDNAGRRHQALWHQEAGQAQGGYFDAQGRSRRRAFLASPLEFSRVSSGFAMRVHPIFKDLRAHRGVDYAAPQGTAVRTVADGVVSFAGRQGGYGNVVEVHHAGDRSTLYAHLSRIDVRTGQRINQGQTVGAVGSTGWSTGPHLHYEFRVAGVHKDPLELARGVQQQPTELSGAARDQFRIRASTSNAHLVLARSLSGRAQPQFE